MCCCPLRRAHFSETGLARLMAQYFVDFTCLQQAKNFQGDALSVTKVEAMVAIKCTKKHVSGVRSVVWDFALHRVLRVRKQHSNPP